MGTEISGYCTLCRSRCGTINTVENGQLVSVRPDASHPTGSAMCMKGRAAPELVHSPHRQLYPMRRTSPKGSSDPGWVRISWEEALSETAARLSSIKKESGAEAVAFSVTTPSGTPLSDSIDWIERFIRSFGSPNTCYGTEICNWHKDFAHAFTFGCGIPPADYSNSDTIVLWGHNPTNTWLAQASAISIGRAKGAKLIVVDPRPTALAKQADVWLPVRPGTDGALALGLLRIMIQEQLYNERFLRNWTNAPLLVRDDNGLFLREQTLWPDATENRYVAWDVRSGVPTPVDAIKSPSSVLTNRFALKGKVEVKLAVGAQKVLSCRPVFELLSCATGSYDAETVERLTGVPPVALKAAAELIRSDKRISYHAWTGIGQHSNATQTERAVATLYALTGSFDLIGGNRVRRGPYYRPVNALEKLTEKQFSKTLGAEMRPIGPASMGWVTARDMYKAIMHGEPYSIRAMMAFGTNLPISQADSSLAEEALKKLEFHVHCDLFETPAAKYADIFLPVNTPWEHEGIRFGFEISDDAASLVQLRQRMVEPRGESRSDNDIIFDLAARMGMAKEFFDGSLENGWNYMLEPLGHTVETLRIAPKGVKTQIDSRERKYSLPHHDDQNRVRAFDTETGRIELYSELLQRNGQPGIPTFIPPAEDEILERKGLRRKFPLVLSSAKNGYYCHSQHRSLASLRKRAPDPVAEIGEGLAKERGIQSGDWIRISTRNGAARFVAKPTPGLADDVVVAEFGWWQSCPEMDRAELSAQGPYNSNANSLISADAVDPISGSIPHRSFRCNIELDPLTELRQRSWKGWKEFRVRQSTIEADGVRSLIFETIDGEELPDFRPGQHIQIQIGDDNGLSRAYSLTGAATVSGRTTYSISVRHQKGVTKDGKYFEGKMSSQIHHALKDGDTVNLRAPSGNFIIPRFSPQPLIFLAGGIGITPFISLLESLPDNDEIQISLLYGNLNGRTHAFRSRIREHKNRLPNFHVFDFYDAPLAEDVEGKDYYSNQRISASMISDELIKMRPRIYMCGPPGMMHAFSEGLQSRGVPKFDIFSEVFRSPPETMMDDGKSFQIQFGRSKNAEWSASQGPILDFAEKIGVALPSGCRVGQCESCAVRIVSGTVQHMHGSEPDDPNVCLTCQARPTSDLVLDI